MADLGFDTWLKSASDEGLVIAVSGRVTADNAPQLEASIADVRAGRDQVPLTLDLKGLEYISSAGLRVLLRLAQSVDALTLENVSPEVYDIFDMTGMSQILDVRRALREISVEGCEVIGRGGNGTVYRLDEDTIVKVYKPWVEIDAIERERDFARTAFINGVPSVIAYDMVLVDDCLGVVFEMIHSDTLGHAMRDNPDKLEEYVDKYVELAKTLHTTHVSGKSSPTSTMCCTSAPTSWASGARPRRFPCSTASSKASPIPTRSRTTTCIRATS